MLSPRANFASVKTPVIFGANGRPMLPRAQFSILSSSGGVYDAAQDRRERTLHGNRSHYKPRPETEMLPLSDRLKIISYLREKMRNNPVLWSLAYRYSLAVGSPTIHAMGPDGGFNDEKERVLERRFRNICYGTGWSWHRLNKIISFEELVAGEVFAVEVEDKIQLIPSELCGAPNAPVAGEIEGIGYDGAGMPLYYRFGVRKADAQGRNSTVSFEEKDAATLVPAEFVTHLGEPSRIEERRFTPKLAPVINLIHHLDEIVEATVTTFKNQAALSFFRTKNFDPGLFTEASALASFASDNAGAIFKQIIERSPPPEEGMRNGTIWSGEVGEDVKLLEPMLKAQNYNDFCLSLLDQICACVGMFPEEVLIGYRKSNYSSARADKNRLKSVLVDIQKGREAFIDRVVERQTGIAVDSRELGAASDGIADVVYAWPALLEIDQSKTVAAQAVALANGTASRQMICAENNKFTDQVQAQIVREAAYNARLVKAYAQYPNPTNADINAIAVSQAEILAHMPNSVAASEALKFLAAAEAAEVNAEANTMRALTEAGSRAVAPTVNTPAASLAAAAKPALIDSIGIGGTQAMTQIIQQVSTGVIPREQGINILSLLFGITREQAGTLVPPQGSAEIVPGASDAPKVTS